MASSGGKRLAVSPDCAIGKGLFLPDRHFLFERVNEPAAGLESGRAMGSGHHDQHAGLADFEMAETVNHGYMTDREAMACLLGQLAHLA